jgi:hypothetical protein
MTTRKEFNTMKSSQYANRMIKLENNAAMTAAIRRCKANHPKARRVAGNRVEVTNKKGKVYQVTLSQPCDGLKLGCCTCTAGLSGKLCYHIAAALACPVWSGEALLPSTLEASHLERERAVLVKPSQTMAREYHGKIEV